MTPPDATDDDPLHGDSEQLVSDACATIENRCGVVRGIGPAMREALTPMLAERDRLRSAAGIAAQQLIHRVDHTPGVDDANCARCIALAALKAALEPTRDGATS